MNEKSRYLSFAPFTPQTTKDGFKSFLTASNKSGYRKEAKFYAQNVGAVAVKKKIDKTSWKLPFSQIG